jgi:hypothetical protein
MQAAHDDSRNRGVANQRGDGKGSFLGDAFPENWRDRLVLGGKHVGVMSHDALVQDDPYRPHICRKEWREV